MIVMFMHLISVLYLDLEIQADLLFVFLQNAQKRALFNGYIVTLIKNFV